MLPLSLCFVFLCSLSFAAAQVAPVCSCPAPTMYCSNGELTTTSAGDLTACTCEVCESGELTTCTSKPLNFEDGCTLNNDCTATCPTPPPECPGKCDDTATPYCTGGAMAERGDDCSCDVFTCTDEERLCPDITTTPAADCTIVKNNEDENEACSVSCPTNACTAYCSNAELSTRNPDTNLCEVCAIGELTTCIQKPETVGQGCTLNDDCTETCPTTLAEAPTCPTYCNETATPYCTSGSMAVLADCSCDFMCTDAETLCPKITTAPAPGSTIDEACEVVIDGCNFNLRG